MSVIAPTAPVGASMAREGGGEEETDSINVSHSRLRLKQSQADKPAGTSVLFNCRAGIAIDQSELPKKLIVIGEGLGHSRENLLLLRLNSILT